MGIGDDVLDEKITAQVGRLEDVNLAPATSYQPSSVAAVVNVSTIRIY